MRISRRIPIFTKIPRVIMHTTAEILIHHIMNIRRLPHPRIRKLATPHIRRRQRARTISNLAVILNDICASSERGVCMCVGEEGARVVPDPSVVYPEPPVSFVHVVLDMDLLLGSTFDAEGREYGARVVFVVGLDLWVSQLGLPFL